MRKSAHKDILKFLQEVIPGDYQTQIQLCLNFLFRTFKELPVGFHLNNVYPF